MITAEEPVEQENGEVPSFSAARAAEGEAGRRACGSPPARSSRRAASSTPRTRQIGTTFAPKFITSVLPEELESQTYVEGHPPRDADRGRRSTRAPPKRPGSGSATRSSSSAERAPPYRLVGLTKLGDASFGGASIARLTLPEAQRITDKRGEFDQISVAADEGVSEAALKRRIERVAAGLVCGSRPRKENADRNSDEIRDNLGFLRIALLVFAFVALFVGAFLIFNTFSITVAQRVTRVRHAAHARRLAAPDPQLGRGRGAGDRPARRAARDRRRLRRSPSASTRLFVAFGIDLPTTGAGDEDAHDRRLAADRDRRHPRLLADPGPALDPGAADRRPAGLAPAASRRRRLVYAGARRCCSAWSAWRWSSSASSAAPSGGDRRRPDGRRRGRDRARRLALQPAPGAAAGYARRAGRWRSCAA